MPSQEFQALLDRIRQVPQLNVFPMLDELFDAYQTESGQLPLASYRMLVPPDERRDALSIQAAVLCIIVGGFVFDNLMDQDKDKPESKLHEGRRANLAASLLVAAYKLINESGFPERVQLRLCDELSTLLLQAARAQELEAQLAKGEVPNDDPEQNYWSIQHGKSSQQIGRFLKLGAILAEKPEWEDPVFQVGVAYGDMLQLVDDMSDALVKEISPDWDSTSKNLMIVFCLNENNPRRAEFLDHFRRAREDASAHRACRQIILDSGALGFGMYQYYDRYLKARKLIQSMQSMEGYDTTPLDSLFRKNVRVITTFLKKMGVELPPQIAAQLKD